MAEGNSGIYLQISYPSGAIKLHEAYCITSDDSDYGFLVYIPLSGFGTLEAAAEAPVVVYTEILS